jgi:hypothetical protein
MSGQMKRHFLILTLCLLLMACGPSAAEQTKQVAFSTAFDSVLATTRADYQLTLTPPPTQTSLLPATKSSTPTLWPTIEPSNIREMLDSAFSIQTVPSINGHTMQLISGWEPGLRRISCRGYQWLDSGHVVLYPRTGQVRLGEGQQLTDLAAQPVVFDLETGHTWLPHTELGICGLLYWSPELEKLVIPHSTDSEQSVGIYTSDGEYQNSFWGALISISPSRKNILVDDDTIIDLVDNSIVDLEWYIDESQYPYQVYWSPDESRVYRCCYYFGDTRTGTSYRFELSELRGAGTRPSPYAIHQHGQWVRNNDFFLIEWNVVDDGYPSYYPMFDPFAKVYYEVAEMAGLPAEHTCAETSVSSSGRHVWIECYEGNYLVDLVTFDSNTYPSGQAYDVNWSANGNYATMWFDDAEITSILSVSNGNLSPLPVQSLTFTRHAWHPVQSILAYVSEDLTKLVLLDAKTMNWQEVELPVAVRHVDWSPNGDHIALFSEDGTLWTISYPSLDDIRQQTQSMMEMRDVLWSPDSARISFVNGVNLYILEIN